MGGAQPAASAKPPPPPPVAKHRESHMADPVLLFRYSALTFNGHRIHYDRDYVTKVEGYPGLIFHGPLQAAFIVEFAAKLHRRRGAEEIQLSRRAAAVRRQRILDQRQRYRRRHGTVDREFGRPADDEGHGDVVRFVIASVIPGRSEAIARPIAGSMLQSHVIRRGMPVALLVAMTACFEQSTRHMIVVPQTTKTSERIRHRQGRHLQPAARVRHQKGVRQSRLDRTAVPERLARRHRLRAGPAGSLRRRHGRRLCAGDPQRRLRQSAFRGRRRQCARQYLHRAIATRRRW